MARKKKVQVWLYRQGEGGPEYLLLKRPPGWHSGSVWQPVTGSMKKGEVAGDNPWESATIEWTTPSPAGHGNWPGELPVVTGSPYEYGDEHPGGFAPQASVESGATEDASIEGGENA